MPIAAAFIGLIVGHILELFLDRSYSDAPLTGPLIRCSACQARARPLHLLPLVGYLWHRGRCPDCGQRLPPRALLLPPAGALVFALAALVYEEWSTTILTGIFAVIFLALAATDLERRLIPNRIVYPSMLLAMVVSWAWPDRNVAQVFAGGGLAFGIMFIVFAISMGRHFGFGDVKMGTLMGLAAGFPAMTMGLFFTAIAGGLVAGPLLVARVLRFGQYKYMPYGPFLALGAILSLLWGGAFFD